MTYVSVLGTQAETDLISRNPAKYLPGLPKDAEIQYCNEAEQIWSRPQLGSLAYVTGNYREYDASNSRAKVVRGEGDLIINALLLMGFADVKKAKVYPQMTKEHSPTEFKSISHASPRIH